MDYKVLIIAAVLLIAIIVIVCVFVIRLKENGGNGPQDVDTEVSGELIIPNVIKARYDKSKSKEFDRIMSFTSEMLPELEIKISSDVK